MAFRTSALPGIAAATTELSSLLTPLKAIRRRAQGTGQLHAQRPQMRRLHQISRPAALRASILEPSPASTPELVENLIPSSASSLAPRIAFRQPVNVRSMVESMNKGTLAAARPNARTGFRFQQPAAISTKIQAIQKRTLFGSSTSRNLLAHVEETANRNPNSATAQNAFYQALLRANMPAIIVERYQTNQFATNAATDAAYQKALASLGHVDGIAANQFGGQSNNLSDMQLQSIGQAVAASSRGGNVAVSRGIAGNGAKNAPLHVVVEETIGGSIFKWVRFIFYFGLFTYISLVVCSMVIETIGTFRKVGKAADNKAKAEHQTVRFSDVHGCEEAKEELQELVEFLKDPAKFSTLGGKLPKGVLLVGPPGTGKTLLARAVAGEAQVPFFFMSGSEFDEVYVGVGARRVRDLFATAKANGPAIVFIDELDAIGGKRNPRDGAYAKQTLNQLLTELDGFEQKNNVIIIAATNFPELLDKALTRPGRFDRHVVVGLPDVRGRMAILKHHMKNVKISQDVRLDVLASGTPGFSGAQLQNIVNQAAVHASKAKAKAVSMFDFEWAKDRVMMGAERTSMVLSQKEKEMTAYHEAGHALVGLFTLGSSRLHKMTIMPRGQALGITFQLPEMDKYSKEMHEFQAEIDVLLGGKVAEELQYGPTSVTSGVSNDLQRATQVAYTMVTRLGMSEKLGNVDLASNYDNLSSGTKQVIESEVRRIIEEARIRATTLLESKRKELDSLAKALVDYETLTGEEVLKVIKGEKLPRKLAMPNAPITVPGVGESPLGGLPTVPPIPGSTPDASGGKEPPAVA